MSFIPAGFVPAGFVPAGLVPHLSLQASPSMLAIGFSVLLVLSLVAAEEIEVRRVRPSEVSDG